MHLQGTMTTPYRKDKPNRTLLRQRLLALNGTETKTAMSSIFTTWNYVAFRQADGDREAASFSMHTSINDDG